MNTKSFLKSKTIWIQIVTVLSTLIPDVGEWIGSNGVTIIQLFGAINVIVRFVTHNKVEIFADGTSSNGAGTPLLIVVVSLGMALGAGCLVSCSALEGVDVNGKIYYQHDSGAMGGVNIVSGRKPGLWFRVPLPQRRDGDRDAVPIVSTEIVAGK